MTPSWSPSRSGRSANLACSSKGRAGEEAAPLKRTKLRRKSKVKVINIKRRIMREVQLKKFNRLLNPNSNLRRGTSQDKQLKAATTTTCTKPRSSTARCTMKKRSCLPATSAKRCAVVSAPTTTSDIPKLTLKTSLSKAITRMSSRPRTKFYSSKAASTSQETSSSTRTKSCLSTPTRQTSRRLTFPSTIRSCSTTAWDTQRTSCRPLRSTLEMTHSARNGSKSRS